MESVSEEEVNEKFAVEKLEGRFNVVESSVGVCLL